MQCHRPLRHAVCNARNAFSCTTALRATFGNTPRRIRHEAVGKHKQLQEQEQELELELELEQELDQKLNQEHRNGLEGASRKDSFATRWPEIPRNDYSLYTQREAHNFENGGQPNLTAYPEQWQTHIGVLMRFAEKVKKRLRITGKVRTQHVRSILDYVPATVKCRAPPNSPKGGSVRHPPAPWELSNEERATLPAPKALSREIERFAKWMEPNPQEKMARKAVREDVMAVMQRVLNDPDAPPTLFGLHGSEKNGLALPTSDIDFRVWLPDDSNEEGKAWSIRKSMRLVFKAFVDLPDYNAVNLRMGQYPIINFFHVASGVQVQIVATGSTAAQEEVIRKYQGEIVNLRALAIIFRTFLAMRNLLTVYTGGLGSYASLVMLIAALKRHEGAAIPSHGQYQPAYQLLNVLKFYDPTSGRFDTMRHGLACSPRQIFLKHDGAADKYKLFSRAAHKRNDPIRAGQWKMCKTDHWQPYLLTLQDPANPDNNLGARSYAIKHILASITKSTHSLLRTMSRYDHMRKSGQPGQFSGDNSFLSRLIGRPDLVEEGARKTLQAYGRKIMEEPESNKPSSERLIKEKRTAELAQELEREEGTPNTDQAGKFAGDNSFISGDDSFLTRSIWRPDLVDEGARKTLQADGRKVKGEAESNEHSSNLLFRKVPIKGLPESPSEAESTERSSNLLTRTSPASGSSLIKKVRTGGLPRVLGRKNGT